MAESIIQKEKECFVCHSTTCLESHHIFGAANRRLSEEYGLWIWLCREHHTGKDGVHFNKDFMQELHEFGQTVFEQQYDRETFIQRFGKNYL